MTRLELHKAKILPLREELSRLEREYEQLYRKEVAEEAGVDRATCDNCAYSCVLLIDDHNGCLGGKCTCCHGFCYKWMPDNTVSAYLREHHEYDSSIIFRLEDLFGEDFLQCDDVELVLKALKLMDAIKEKAKEKRYEKHQQRT